jgi:hypothetical protein
MAETMDRETSVRRLMLVVAKLRALPVERFDYGRWVGQNWQDAPDLSCGTTACALGWATTIPELAAAGLRLKRGTDGYVYVSDGTPDDSSFASFHAASGIFGISTDDAEYLFAPGVAPPKDDSFVGSDDSPRGCAGPAEVADHIERFVRLRFGVIA